MKWFCSRKLDISKRFFFTNCDEMLNFVKSKNGVLACVLRCILDGMLGISWKRLIARWTDTSAYLVM